MLNLNCDLEGYIYKHKKNDKPKLKFVGNIYQKSAEVEALVFLEYNNSELGLGLWELLNKLFLLLQ